MIAILGLGIGAMLRNSPGAIMATLGLLLAGALVMVKRRDA
jgi:hypothetical protein